MKASVAGRVRHTTLPKTKPLLPLFEAIVNAFQAIEEAGGKSHSIDIQAERQQSLLPEDASSPILTFSVTDTGIGFTEPNYESFNTVDSPYRAAQGGKGLGRFIWLKAFSRVEIDSHYLDTATSSIIERKFCFTPTDEQERCEIGYSDSTCPHTTVRLCSYLPPFMDECPRSLDIIAQQMVAHFLPFFFEPTGPFLSLRDEFNKIDLRDFFRINFQSLATVHKFNIADLPFTIHGFHLKSAAAFHHELVYGAQYREVLSERLARFRPNLKNKLNDPERGNFAYLAFLQSPFLDEKVNSERTDFTFSKEPMDLFPAEVTLQAIRNSALSAIDENLKPYFDKINESKEAGLTAYVTDEAPQFRPLLKYKAEFIDQIPPGASSTDLDAILHRQLHQREMQLRQEGTRILAEVLEDPNDYYARVQQFVERANKIGKSALVQYVAHRRVILGLFEKAVAQDLATRKFALERTVHGLVFPLRMTSDDVPLEQQNLWIIDERLTYHSFLASDVALNKYPGLDTDSLDRPDIAIFDRPLAFSDEGQPLTSLVVVEFKRPNRDEYKESPVAQVFRLVREIREGQARDNKGLQIRPQNQDIPAYCYVICDLTPALDILLQEIDATHAPDNQGYFGYNQHLRAYYEVISYAKLLNDARKRNRILFDKLNVPLR